MKRKRGHDRQTEGQCRECLWTQALIYKDGEFNKDKNVLTLILTFLISEGSVSTGI